MTTIIPNHESLLTSREDSHDPLPRIMLNIRQRWSGSLAGRDARPSMILAAATMPSPRQR